MKNKNSTIVLIFNKLPIFICVFFGLVFLSVPVFSFSQSLFFITWVLTAILVLLIIIYLILKGAIKVDLIYVCLALFSISSIISSAMNGFAAFRITAPFLSLLLSLIYLYLINCSSQNKRLLLSAFLANCIFLIVFICVYSKELFTLNPSRLGEKFGDINDIALFMCFGAISSLYACLFVQKIWVKLLCALFLAFYCFCGLATGSKIFFIVLFICFPVLIFLRNGKNKWWVSLIIVISVFGLIFLLLQLPIFSSIKVRLIEMFCTLFGIPTADYSGSLSTIVRFEMFQTGIEMFFRKPLFGWGIWGFATYSGIAESWSHNNISESLCNFGIVGTILFHTGFICSYIGCAKKRTYKDNHLSFVLLIMFTICMLSVALNSEKIYVLLAPIVYSSLSIKILEYQFIIRKAQLYENC